MMSLATNFALRTLTVMAFTLASRAVGAQSYSVVEVPRLPGVIESSIDVKNALAGVGLFVHAGGCCGVYAWDSSGIRTWTSVTDVQRVHINNHGSIAGVRYRDLGAAADNRISNPRVFVLERSDAYLEAPVPPIGVGPLYDESLRSMKLTDSGILSLHQSAEVNRVPGRFPRHFLFASRAFYQSRFHQLSSRLIT